jgi:hypothetical protein
MSNWRSYELTVTTYRVRSHKCFEDAVEFGRCHILLVLAIIASDFCVGRVRCVDIVDEVFKLTPGLAGERPHPFGKLAFGVGMMLVELFPQTFVAISDFSQALSHVQQVD